MQYEKKSIPVTIRLTPSQNSELKRLAEEQDQSVSQYVAEHIFQNDGITDTQLRQVFLSLKKIQDNTEFQMKTEQNIKDTIFKECDAIWQLLKS